MYLERLKFVCRKVLEGWCLVAVLDIGSLLGEAQLRL